MLEQVTLAMPETIEKPILAHLRRIDHFKARDYIMCFSPGYGVVKGIVICVHEQTGQILVELTDNLCGHRWNRKESFNLTNSAIMLRKE